MVGRIFTFRLRRTKSSPGTTGADRAAPRHRRRSVKRGRRVVLFTLAGYLIIQLAFILWADFFQPGIYDPEYDCRARVFEQRLAETPHKPTLLLFGSSRSVGLFRPEWLPPLHTAGGQEVLPFNFSHTYGGPSYAYLTYRRLIEQGHVPRWIVIEIMPMIARKQQKEVYTSSIVAREFGWFVGHHETGDLLVEYLKTRAIPWQRLRAPIMHRYFSAIDVSPPNFLISGPYDRFGGFDLGVQTNLPSPELIAAHIRAATEANGPAMVHFTADPRGDRSLRALLDLCREKGTSAAIMLSPESPAFRTHYTPEAYREVREYYSALSASYGIPFIDAREWLDESDFADGHHAVISGQAKFTDRMGKEFLMKWVEKPGTR